MIDLLLGKADFENTEADLDGTELQYDGVGQGVSWKRDPQYNSWQSISGEARPILTDKAALCYLDRAAIGDVRLRWNQQSRGYRVGAVARWTAGPTPDGIFVGSPGDRRIRVYKMLSGTISQIGSSRFWRSPSDIGRELRVIGVAGSGTITVLQKGSIRLEEPIPAGTPNEGFVGMQNFMRYSSTEYSFIWVQFFTVIPEDFVPNPSPTDEQELYFE